MVMMVVLVCVRAGWHTYVRVHASAATFIHAFWNADIKLPPKVFSTNITRSQPHPHHPLSPLPTRLLTPISHSPPPYHPRLHHSTWNFRSATAPDDGLLQWDVHVSLQRWATINAGTLGVPPGSNRSWDYHLKKHAVSVRMHGGWLLSGRVRYRVWENGSA